MRHQVRGRKFGRKSGPRLALMKSLSNALITHGRIETTLPKAKELRMFIEPLVTASKEENAGSYRKVCKYLKNRDIVQKLFKEIGPKFKERPGGYTRIYKTGRRTGDNAPMSVISFVEDITPPQS